MPMRRVTLVTHCKSEDHGGGADRVHGVVDALRELGVEVQVVELPVRTAVRNRRLAPWWYFDTTASWRTELRRTAADSDLTIASYLPIAHQVVRAFADANESHPPLVYDAHNDETALARQTMSSRHASIVERMQDTVIGASAITWIAGLADWSRLRANYPTHTFICVPNGVEAMRDTVHYERPKNTVAIYGSWDYLPNVEGIMRLADVETSDGGQVKVFGSMPSGLRRRLMRLTRRTQPRLEWKFEGFADELSAIALAGTGVIPVWKGGGTKLRAVQLAAMGAPYIAAPEALSGLPSWFVSAVPTSDDPTELLSRALSGTGAGTAVRAELRSRVLSELSWKSALRPGFEAARALIGGSDG